LLRQGLEDEEVGDYLKWQDEMGEGERRALVAWLLQVCEEECVQIEVFCLAVNCMDRFLSLVPLKLGQLQLLGSACLLVAWKVREDREITVHTVLKYSNYNVSADELLEWEMLVLAKLQWNISPVVAVDLLEHIVKGLYKLRPCPPALPLLLSLARPLVPHCHTHYTLARLPPPVLAAVAILAAIRPMLQMPPPPNLILDTPPPSSTSSSCHSSPEISPIKQRRSPRCRSSSSSSAITEMDRLISKVQKITLVDRSLLTHSLKQLEDSLHTPLPHSPPPSLSTSPESSGIGFSTSSPLPHAARTLFTHLQTPTKLFDAARI